jgi:hypothetical protein
VSNLSAELSELRDNRLSGTETVVTGFVGLLLVAVIGVVDRVRVFARVL